MNHSAIYSWTCYNRYNLLKITQGLPQLWVAPTEGTVVEGILAVTFDQKYGSVLG